MNPTYPVALDQTPCSLPEFPPCSLPAIFRPLTFDCNALRGLNEGMKNLPLTHLLDTAICAAEAAGKHALSNKDRRTEASESFAHDVKLVLDVECQKIAEKIILSEFPEHGILGEEGERKTPEGDYEWVIDPIDGTMNYTHGFPYWCVSIAVRRNGRVLAGCIFAPESNEFYTAHIEEAAKCNGIPIHASDTPEVGKAMIFTGISKHMEANQEPHFKAFETLALSARKLRINGSAALDMCHVAAGHADGYFEANLYLWDHAAAGLIAEQAGAAIALYPLDGEPHACGVICANKNLIDPLRAIHDNCF